MAIQKAEAFVLQRRPLRETSLIVTLLTREFGKIKVVAKGVRTGKSPTASILEPFTCLSIVYYEKTRSDIHLLSQASVIRTNSHLRNDLNCFGYASYMSEFVEQVCQIQDPHPDIFDLMNGAFDVLSRLPFLKVVRVFEVKLFGMVGWLPALTSCIGCGEKVHEQAYFSSKHGGILCARCHHGEGRGIVISKYTIQTLLYFLKLPIEQASMIAVGKQIEAELTAIIEKFLRYRLEYPLNSSHFMSEIGHLFNKKTS